MGRLPGFDYKRPFFYMVTLKRAARVLQGDAPAAQVLQDAASAASISPGADAPGYKTTAPAAPAFSAVSEEGRVEPNAVTEAFEAEIAGWARFWRSVESVSPHVVMPDHLHLLVKLAAVEKAVSLPVVVGDLRKRLNRAYGRVLLGGAPAPSMATAGAATCKTTAPTILDPEWHDWIVKKEGQLAAFRKYILENPPRYARRRANRRFFTQARRIEWRGAAYWAYGNEELLELPEIVAIKGHRRPPILQQPAPAGAAGAAPCKTIEPIRGTVALLASAARIGPGGAGLSTFLSPLEKAAGNEIAKAGGSLIVLSMQGFGERWHPGAKQERLCAEGRMLYLSPYPPQAAKLTKQEMHLRAHALADWALAHSHEQLEAWPVLQGAAPAAPTFPGADAPGCKTTAPAAPTTSAADAPGRPTTSCATKP